MEVDIGPDGTLFLIATTGVETYALKQWDENKIARKITIVEHKDGNYLPICVELTKMMKEERDSFRAWQHEKLLMKEAKK